LGGQAGGGLCVATPAGAIWRAVHARTVAHAVISVAAGPSMQSIGNHEMDYGPGNLAGFADVLDAPLLRCRAAHGSSREGCQ